LPAPEPWLSRAWRFGRALIVGSGATITDFSVFTACVRAIGIGPAEARLPALLAGACFQFFGNRSFTFRAQAGNLSRQARLFVLFEAVTLGLNFGLFRLLLPRLPWLPPELVTFIGTFVVFVAFAYPIRRLVIFKLPEPEPEPEPELVASQKID
jgi:putative flippase GtrA